MYACYFEIKNKRTNLSRVEVIGNAILLALAYLHPQMAADIVDIRGDLVGEHSHYSSVLTWARDRLLCVEFAKHCASFLELNFHIEID